MSPVVRRLALTAVLLAAAAWPASAQAAVSLAPVGTFDRPIGVVSPPGDTSRLLVVERAGRVRLVKNGVVQGPSFLDIAGLVEAGIGEGGLLSIALAPDYATTGRLYAYYTAAGTGATAPCPSSTTDANRCPPIRVDEFRSSGGSADTVSAASRRPVLEIAHPKYSNHYGGQLQFDAAGRLYIGVGDGGSGGDPDGNAQSLTTLLGKLLRIDPRPSGGASYTVPSDNPLAAAAGRREIWAYGLRNPFRFSLDRQIGDVLIGDVGQAEVEEVDFHARSQGAGRGRSFGWNVCEGNLRYPVDGSACPLSGGNYLGPIHTYANAGAPSCAITGGYVVRDASLEELRGQYVYSDYCTGEVRRLQVPDGGGDALVLDLPDFNVASFGEDACARLYVAELNTGAVSRLTDGTSTCSSALALPPAPPDGPAPVTPPPSGAEPGGMPATGSGPPVIAPDARSPLLGLRTGGRQRVLRNRGVIVRARCDEPCSYRVGARLNIRRGKRKIRALGRTGSLRADHTARLRLRLSRASARMLRRALRRGRRVWARVEVRVRDRAGNLSRGSRLVRLVR